MSSKTRVRLGWELATLEAALEGARILTDSNRHGGLQTEHDDRVALPAASAITSLVALRMRDLCRVLRGEKDATDVVAPHNQTDANDPGDEDILLTSKAGRRK